MLTNWLIRFSKFLLLESGIKQTLQMAYKTSGRYFFSNLGHNSDYIIQKSEVALIVSLFPNFGNDRAYSSFANQFRDFVLIVIPGLYIISSNSLKCLIPSVKFLLKLSRVYSVTETYKVTGKTTLVSGIRAWCLVGLDGSILIYFQIGCQ